MALQGLWFKYDRIMWIGGVGTYTYDLYVPKQSVFATSIVNSLNWTAWFEGISDSGSQGFGGWSGVMSYSKNGDPENVGLGQLGGIVPAISDSGVDRVTFRCAVAAQPVHSPYANETIGDFTFQIISTGAPNPAEQDTTVTQDRTAILYDSDGRIMHTHRAISFAGATRPSDADVVIRARECSGVSAARSTERPTLEAIVVGAGARQAGKAYNVDPSSKKLQEIVKGAGRDSLNS